MNIIVKDIFWINVINRVLQTDMRVLVSNAC